MKQSRSILPSARILAGISILLALFVPALLVWKAGAVTASAAQPPGGTCTVAAAGAVDYNSLQNAVDDLSCSTIIVAAGTRARGSTAWTASTSRTARFRETAPPETAAASTSPPPESST